MQPYEMMSTVYDELINDVDYQAWINYIQEVLSRQRARPYKVLEIGAGTGNMTRHLLALSMHITIVEPSGAMLSVLQSKYIDDMKSLAFFNAELSVLETQQQYDAAFAFLDVLNYIEPHQLRTYFKKLHQLLKPNALCFLDWSTPYKLAHIIGDATFAENHEDFAYIWENTYDQQSGQLHFEFTVFSENADGSYQKNVEYHTQYAHDEAHIKLAYKGLFDDVESCGDAFGLVKPDDQRRHLVLKVVK